MNPAELSHQLRKGRGGHLEERRGVVALALAAAGCMGVIACYQMGLVRHLPGLPSRWFNSDKVNSSAEAYSHLQMGDAFLGLGSYSVTAGLAALGGKNRAQESPWIPLALAAKAAADAGVAAKLTRDEWVKHRTFSVWSLLAAGATFATAALVLPEAKAAVRELRRRKMPARTRFLADK